MAKPISGYGPQAPMGATALRRVCHQIIEQILETTKNTDPEQKDPTKRTQPYNIQYTYVIQIYKKISIINNLCTSNKTISNI